MNTISLLEVQVGKYAEVSQITGKDAKSFLGRLGLSVGEKIMVRRRSYFKGPIKVDVMGSSVGISRDLASSILVDIK